MTPILEIQNLSHIYSPDTPFEHPALTNVDLTIGRGEFVGLIGHTGSGKSTLVQHMNGLLKPTSAISGRMQSSPARSVSTWAL